MQRTPRLKELRERAALSQEDLAEISNVARATIADLEAGKRPARPSTLRKLAKGLQVDVTDFLGEPDSPLVEALPSQDKLFNNGVLEEERRRAEYVPRVWPRIKQLEHAAEQWQRFTDEGLYDLRSLSFEDLQTIDAVSLSIVINHSQDVHELKQACTPEQLERLKQAEKSYFDANLGFWAQVENTLARQRVSDIAERRAQLQARRTEMERLADLA
jgi:transcriptional regulator with XRE-family HTH domain